MASPEAAAVLGSSGGKAHSAFRIFIPATRRVTFGIEARSELAQQRRDFGLFI